MFVFLRVAMVTFGQQLSSMNEIFEIKRDTNEAS